MTAMIVPTPKESGNTTDLKAMEAGRVVKSANV